MNKEIIDCIKAEKEKEIVKRKEKEAKIQKIKDFFDELPAGTYRIPITDRIEKKVRDYWYSKPWSYAKYIPKEPWCKNINAEWIEIKKHRDINIDKGRTRYPLNIERWSDDVINIFYEHLDWFEKELGRQYCKKP